MDIHFDFCKKFNFIKRIKKNQLKGVDNVSSMVDKPDEPNLRSENGTKGGILGLTTEDALERLSQEIRQVLKSYETKFKKERFAIRFRCNFYFQSIQKNKFVSSGY